MLSFGIPLMLLLQQSSSCKRTVIPQEGLRQLEELPDVLTECSGMAIFNGDLIALNDSGHETQLYVFNPKERNRFRIIEISNVSNHDWESMAEDERYYYIGDFGNNNGNRKNLRIYRISKETVKSSNAVLADTISFAYAGQTTFKKSAWHNYDCEAMIAYGDSLYLFSKNRGDFRTDVYSVPKTPGHHQAIKMSSYDSEGLVTGADFRIAGQHGELVLIGYEVHGKALYPFLIYFPEVKGSDFFSGESFRQEFRDVLQTETVIFSGPGSAYLTNEEEHGAKGYLYEVPLKP